MKEKTDPLLRVRRLRVDESPRRKADTIAISIRIPRWLEKAFQVRGDALGIPPTTLMRRVLEAYNDQVIAEDTLISPDES